MIRNPLVLGFALVAIALPTALSSQAIADKPNTPTRPITPGITWERSGGFAGICQRLTVRPSATYVLEDCRQQKVVGRGTLPAAERNRLQTQWLKRYGSFQWQNTIRGADMFSDRYSFGGQGRQQPTALEKAALNQYLAELAGKLQTTHNNAQR